MLPRPTAAPTAASMNVKPDDQVLADVCAMSVLPPVWPITDLNAQLFRETRLEYIEPFFEDFERNGKRRQEPNHVPIDSAG